MCRRLAILVALGLAVSLAVGKTDGESTQSEGRASTPAADADVQRGGPRGTRRKVGPRVPPRKKEEQALSSSLFSLSPLISLFASISFPSANSPMEDGRSKQSPPDRSSEISRHEQEEETKNPQHKFDFLQLGDAEKPPTKPCMKKGNPKAEKKMKSCPPKKDPCRQSEKMCPTGYVDEEEEKKKEAERKKQEKEAEEERKRKEKEAEKERKRREEAAKPKPRKEAPGPLKSQCRAAKTLQREVQKTPCDAWKNEVLQSHPGADPDPLAPKLIGFALDQSVVCRRTTPLGLGDLCRDSSECDATKYLFCIPEDPMERDRGRCSCPDGGTEPQSMGPDGVCNLSEKARESLASCEDKILRGAEAMENFHCRPFLPDAVFNFLCESGHEEELRQAREKKEQEEAEIQRKIEEDIAIRRGDRQPPPPPEDPNKPCPKNPKTGKAYKKVCPKRNRGCTSGKVCENSPDAKGNFLQFGERQRPPPTKCPKDPKTGQPAAKVCPKGKKGCKTGKICPPKEEAAEQEQQPSSKPPPTEAEEVAIGERRKKLTEHLHEFITFEAVRVTASDKMSALCAKCVPVSAAHAPTCDACDFEDPKAPWCQLKEDPSEVKCKCGKQGPVERIWKEDLGKCLQPTAAYASYGGSCDPSADSDPAKMCDNEHRLKCGDGGTCECDPEQIKAPFWDPVRNVCRPRVPGAKGALCDLDFDCNMTVRVDTEGGGGKKTLRCKAHVCEEETLPDSSCDPPCDESRETCGFDKGAWKCVSWTKADRECSQCRSDLDRGGGVRCVEEGTDTDKWACTCIDEGWKWNGSKRVCEAPTHGQVCTEGGCDRRRGLKCTQRVQVKNSSETGESLCLCDREKGHGTRWNGRMERCEDPVKQQEGGKCVDDRDCDQTKLLVCARASGKCLCGQEVINQQKEMQVIPKKPDGTCFPQLIRQPPHPTTTEDRIKRLRKEGRGELDLPSPSEPNLEASQLSLDGCRQRTAPKDSQCVREMNANMESEYRVDVHLKPKQVKECSRCQGENQVCLTVEKRALEATEDDPNAYVCAPKCGPGMALDLGKRDDNDDSPENVVTAATKEANCKPIKELCDTFKADCPKARPDCGTAERGAFFEEILSNWELKCESPTGEDCTFVHHEYVSWRTA